MDAAGVRRPSLRRTFRWNPREFDPKHLPKWAEEFSQFILLTSHQHADVKTKCVLIQKLYKKNSFSGK